MALRRSRVIIEDENGLSRQVGERMNTAATSASARFGGERILQFVRGTFAPRQLQVAPPNVLQDTSFIKTIDYQGNHIVVAPDADSAIGTKGSGRGMLLWLVGRGVDSVTHMGFVSKGYTIAGFAGPPGAPLYVLPDQVPWGLCAKTWAPIDPTTGLPLPYNYNVTTNGNQGPLTFLQELALPYIDGVDAVKISPELDVNFSSTRMFSGLLQLTSDTTPIGVTTTNGVFSMGSLADTRDICQSQDGAFTAVNLVQSSVTAREGIKQINHKDGAVTLMGPDIPQAYTLPNKDNASSVDGSHTCPIVLPAKTWDLQLSEGATRLRLADFFQRPNIASQTWVSPWRTEIKQFSTATGAPTITNLTPATSSDLGAIAENGVLNATVACEIQWTDNRLVFQDGGGNGSNKYSVKMDLFLSATHYFCGLSSDGNIVTKTMRDSKYIGSRWSNVTGETYPALRTAGFDCNPNAPQGGQKFSFDTRSCKCESLAEGGKYIGTMFEVVSVGRQVAQEEGSSFQEWFLLPAGNPPVATIDATNNPGLQFTHQLTITAIAPEINIPGEVGPARVIRYDNLEEKQSLRINGLANVQCVPQGNLAPFTQDAAANANEIMQLNALPFLSELYDGAEMPLKRNWNGLQYSRLIDEYFQSFTMERVADLLEVNPKLAEAAGAAGFFSDLGRLGGKALGSLIGGSEGGAIGSAIGQQLGGLGDQHLNLGAGGEFGAMAQFGGAGQFGSAPPMNSAARYAHPM